MEDPYGRSVTTLRISLTNRCNLRCRYCMPAGGVATGPREELLTLEELTRVAQVAVAGQRSVSGGSGGAAVELGLRKVRLTGGEPLLRSGISDFISRLSRLDRLEEVALTTNGLRLARMAPELAAAGLKRVNVSLDSLDPAGYRKLTRGGDLARVLEGLEAARAAGLPLKLNCVVMRGVNEDQLGPLVELAASLKAQARFIEYMPLDGGNSWSPAKVVRAPEILKRLEQAGITAKPLPANGGVARLYRTRPGNVTLGLITPLSEPFCSTCNRLRLSATGTLYPCLYSTEGIDLKGPLRAGIGDIALAALLARAVTAKPAGSPMALKTGWRITRSMCGMGG